MLTKIIKELENLKNPGKARGLQRFFKTGKGEYGEGDVFWGITVPQQREIAKKFFKEESLQDIESLLHSKIHEHRLTALIMLVMKYKKASEKERKEIFDLYLKNTKWINNWDLVDLSSPQIIGEYIFNNAARYPEERERRRIPSLNMLKKLAHSSSLWERRIAVLATFAAIRQNNFGPSLKIAEMLLHDKQDLIHKAVGWMIREVGKRDKKVLIEFLDKHAQEMPRVMMRYAIEKLDKKDKEKYL
jgi:3-methyladenine DNA glycosylase AlkD